MLKATLFSVLTSAAILLGSIFADGVVIDHNTPETLNPGEKKIVSVCINKGEVTGFAKLQLEIPAGLTVRPIKKSGASFTFSGQKAKFIWMTLPDTQNFCIEYELEANSTVCGPKVITGQFSYIKENERIDYDVESKTIEVGNCGGTAENEGDSDTSTSTDQSSTNAFCGRTVTEIDCGEFLVKLECSGVNTDGFAKYIENIPSGYTISEDTNGDAIVTVDGDQIKFVWFEKPSDSSFSVSYKLSGTPNEEPSIQGQFSYINNNAPVDAIISSSQFNSDIECGAVADNSDNTTEPENASDDNQNQSSDQNSTDTPDPATTDSSDEGQANTNSSTQEDNSSMGDNGSNTSAQQGNTESQEDATASITDIPDAEEGVTYKVQLAATHKYMSGAKFKAVYKFNGDVQLENHEGWTKYVTGSHTVYKDARDARNSVTAAYPKFKGPFVTAYNYGERITVQEALMVTKQKWYQ